MRVAQIRDFGLLCALFSLGLGGIPACSSSSSRSATPCQDGDQRPCACAGTSGVQLCASGSFGACQCGDGGLGDGSAGAAGSGGTAGAGGSAGQDAGPGGQGGSGLATGKSCAGLKPCAGGVSCCATAKVEGGKFQRDNDPAPEYTATVASFSLDVFEVTVGRFRNFVAAGAAAWAPVAGAGKHTHLGPDGLTGPEKETGWAAEWQAGVPLNDWNTALTTCAKNGNNKKPTWTASVGQNENLPLNCVDFAPAYAFCIWDGGFLPSEAELNYAFVGGDEQRVYPWGTPPALGPKYAVYEATTALPPEVGSAPDGAGRWGHFDLAGSLFEWTLDASSASYPLTPCTNCVSVSNMMHPRAIRGGGWESGPLDVSATKSYPWDGSGNNVGFRCAYPPKP